MGFVRLAEIQAMSAFPGVSHRLAVGKASGATGILRNDGRDPLRIVFAWPTAESVARYWDT